VEDQEAEIVERVLLVVEILVMEGDLADTS